MVTTHELLDENTDDGALFFEGCLNGLVITFALAVITLSGILLFFYWPN